VFTKSTVSNCELAVVLCTVLLLQRNVMGVSETADPQELHQHYALLHVAA
jgi:hypothetical protein